MGSLSRPSLPFLTHCALWVLGSDSQCDFFSPGQSQCLWKLLQVKGKEKTSGSEDGHVVLTGSPDSYWCLLAGLRLDMGRPQPLRTLAAP